MSEQVGPQQSSPGDSSKAVIAPLPGASSPEDEPTCGRIVAYDGDPGGWAALFGMHLSGRGESAIHELIRVVDAAEDSGVVRQALNRIVIGMTGAVRAELVPAPGQARPVHGDRHGEDPGRSPSVKGNGSVNGPTPDGRGSPHPDEIGLDVRVAGRLWGSLRIKPRAGQCQDWPSELWIRLQTLGTMAACAIDRMELEGRVARREAEHDAMVSDDSPASSSTLADDRDGDDREASSCSASLRDSTFLHAVLPFAVGQARRHGECLSLLCIAIDRLGGIRELFGPGCADLLVQDVGMTIAGLLRGSDIIARLDDNRIIAALPRAQIQDALQVGQELCRKFRDSRPPLAGLPTLTISVGVATFPDTANQAHELIDVADHALSQARCLGCDRAAVATGIGQKHGVGLSRHAC